ncbi:hypothetical protein DL767_006186 [Monosporascus sp. MG133]|nr:hypothetical protein DL767_006186 [Monosporascus sp. MG133]
MAATASHMDQQQVDDSGGGGDDGHEGETITTGAKIPQNLFAPVSSQMPWPSVPAVSNCVVSRLGGRRCA